MNTVDVWLFLSLYRPNPVTTLTLMSTTSERWCYPHVNACGSVVLVLTHRLHRSSGVCISNSSETNIVLACSVVRQASHIMIAAREKTITTKKEIKRPVGCPSEQMHQDSNGFPRLEHTTSASVRVSISANMQKNLNIDICFTFLPSPALEKAPQRSRTILLPGLHVLSVGGGPKDQEPFTPPVKWRVECRNCASRGQRPTLIMLSLEQEFLTTMAIRP